MLSRFVAKRVQGGTRENPQIQTKVYLHSSEYKRIKTLSGLSTKLRPSFRYQGRTFSDPGQDVASRCSSLSISLAGTCRETCIEGHGSPIFSGDNQTNTSVGLISLTDSTQLSISDTLAALSLDSTEIRTRDWLSTHFHKGQHQETSSSADSQPETTQSSRSREASCEIASQQSFTASWQGIVPPETDVTYRAYSPVIKQVRFKEPDTTNIWLKYSNPTKPRKIFPASEWIIPHHSTRPKSCQHLDPKVPTKVSSRIPKPIPPTPGVLPKRPRSPPLPTLVDPLGTLQPVPVLTDAEKHAQLVPKEDGDWREYLEPKRIFPNYSKSKKKVYHKGKKQKQLCNNVADKEKDALPLFKIEVAKTKLLKTPLFIPPDRRETFLQVNMRTDQDLVAELKLEAAFLPRTTALLQQLKSKARKFISEWDMSLYTMEQVYQMVMRAIGHAMIVSPEEEKVRALLDTYAERKVIRPIHNQFLLSGQTNSSVSSGLSRQPIRRNAVSEHLRNYLLPHLL